MKTNDISADIEIRNIRPTDHARIIAVLTPWWSGRELNDALPRLFFDHFTETSFVAERKGVLVAFLVGFLSPTRKAEGYIHFAGVHPDYRGRGVGALLYDRFFRICRDDGRNIIRACTSPVNGGSIAFHQALGFRITPGDDEINGVQVSLHYNRPGDSKVLFVKTLTIP